MNIVITSYYYNQRSSLTLACRKDELDELELGAIGALYKAVGGWLDVVVKVGGFCSRTAFTMTMIPGKFGGQHPPTECWS